MYIPLPQHVAIMFNGGLSTSFSVTVLVSEKHKINKHKNVSGILRENKKVLAVLLPIKYR